MKKIILATGLWPALLFASAIYAAETATSPTIQRQANALDVRILPATNAKQPFDMAAKLQWNPHDKRWDKVLVLYNGCANPPDNHPVWDYLKQLPNPGRPPAKPGENLAYRPFKVNAFCDGKTPLSSGQAMQVSFNDAQLGAYQEKDYFRDWNCPDWCMGMDKTAIVNGPQSRTGKDHSLRLTLPRGLAGCDTEASCVNWKPALGAQLESLYYSYWVKFPEQFDFVLGGKLPGIGSEDPNSGGTKPTGRDGWSVRAMWNREGKLGQYVYHMDQPKHFGDFFEWNAAPIEKGKWHRVKTYVRLNQPGKRDGMIRSWLDGQVVLDKRDLRFRLGNDLKIERFLFSVFYGGSGPEWAPARDMQLYLDDFMISVADH